MSTINERMLDIFEEAHKQRCGTERRFCYVESHRQGPVWGLSIVEEGEPGHFPLSDDTAPTGSDQMMRGIATMLNRTRLDILPRDAGMIVASSMAGPGTKSGARR